MANKNLITGAALVGQSKISDWSGAFQKGLQASITAANVQQANRKAQKNAINARTASYIDSLNSNVDVSELTGAQQSAITNYLVKKRNEYAAAASQLARMEDPADPQYMELRNTLNGIQASFTNLAAQVKEYKQDKADYLKDFENKTLSDGNDLNTLNEASKMYTNEAELGVNEGGGLVFWNNNTGNYDSYNQMQKPFLKDFKTADSLLQLNETVYNAGSALTGARKNMIRQKLNNMITQGGRETLLSLASDDFIIEGGLGINDPDLFLPGNEDLLKDAVLDSYMNVLSDSAAQGARDKRKSNPSGRGAGGFSGALRDEINLAEPVINDALNFALNGGVNVPAEQREAKTTMLVDMINTIDPSKSSPYVTRGQFYNMYLDAFDLDDDEETRKDFISEFGDYQIYRFNTSDPSMTRPVAINTDDPKQLYEFYLKNTGLSDKAINYFLGQYDNFVKQVNSSEEQPEQTTNESTSDIDTSKYN